MKKTTTTLAALALSALLLAGCAARPSATSPAITADATAAAAPAGDGAKITFSNNESKIAQYTASIGDVASTDFTLTDLDGKSWTLSDLKGKIVLLNFWATWCGPCQNEMPHFEALWQQWKDSDDVVVLAVASATLEGADAATARQTVTDFVTAQGFTFPVLFDEDGTVWNAYQQQGIPANYIVDRQGNLRLLVSGAFSEEGELYAALEAVNRADAQ